jgi:hypothetical protein
MATIRLFRDELEEGRLPRVCMRCGAPACVFRRKRFAWGPGWVMALICVGALCSGPLLVVALFILVPVFLRTMAVPVPLCAAHRHHWRALNILIVGGLSVFGLLVFTAIVLGLTGTGRGDWRTDLAGPLAVGAVLFLVCLLFPAAFLQTQTIRTVEITPEGIRLANVSREFARALDDALRESRSRRPEGLFRGDLGEKIRLPSGGPVVRSAVPPGQLAELMEQLKDPRPHMRWDAARRLGRLGAVAREALPQLAELADDPDGGVRGAVREALHAIEPEEDDQGHR